MKQLSSLFLAHVPIDIILFNSYIIPSTAPDRSLTTRSCFLFVRDISAFSVYEEFHYNLFIKENFRNLCLSILMNVYRYNIINLTVRYNWIYSISLSGTVMSMYLSDIYDVIFVLFTPFLAKLVCLLLF